MVWKVQFLDCFSKLNGEALACILQTDQNAELYDLSDVEVTKVINHISNGKALGFDFISVEVYKKRGPFFNSKLTALFQTICNDNLVFQIWKTHYHFQFTNVRGVENFVITTDVSLYYQLFGKSFSFAAQYSVQTSWRLRNNLRESMWSSC